VWFVDELFNLVRLTTDPFGDDIVNTSIMYEHGMLSKNCEVEDFGVFSNNSVVILTRDKRLIYLSIGVELVLDSLTDCEYWTSLVQLSNERIVIFGLNESKGLITLFLFGEGGNYIHDLIYISNDGNGKLPLANKGVAPVTKTVRFVRRGVEFVMFYTKSKLQDPTLYLVAIGKSKLVHVDKLDLGPTVLRTMTSN